MNDRFISPVEAAALLKVSKRTIRRYIADGRLQAYRVGPRSIRIKLEDVEAMLRPIPTVTSVL